MLIIWGVVWGALFGGALGHNDFFGSIVGGFFGFFAGLSLQLIIGSKIKASTVEAQRALAAAWEAEEKRKNNAARRAEVAKPLVRVEGVTAVVAANLSASTMTAENQAETASNSAPVAEFGAVSGAVQGAAPNVALDAAQGQPSVVAPKPFPASAASPVSSSRGTSPPAPKVPHVYVQPEPTFIERGFAAAKNWLFGGNTVVRVGIVVLFLGLLFLAKFAVDNNLIPIEFRLAAIGLTGVALLAVGWWNRGSRPSYSLNLQGAGVAVLYLTTFAALKLYHLIDPGFAFAVMVAVCALSTILALLQNSRAMAIIGFTGGFLVPVLLSTGGGSHIALFSYFAILNVAILAIAWFKTWRLLSVIGFVLTFGIAAAWAGRSYQAVHYANCQGFLVAGWAIYLLIGLIYANRPAKAADKTGAGFVDGTLVFGMALAGFGMQAAMVRNTPYATAFSAVIVGGVYLALALWQISRANHAAALATVGGVGGEEVAGESAGAVPRLAGESLLAVGVGFATLAIPLAFGAEVTAAAWAIEGAAIVWVGMRQRRWLARAFGFALQPLAMLTFYLGIHNGTWQDAAPVTQFFLNTQFVGMLLLALGAGVIGWVLRAGEEPNADSNTEINADANARSALQRGYESIERLLAAPASWYAFVVWCLAIKGEISRIIPSADGIQSYRMLLEPAHHILTIMMMILLSATASFIVGRRLAWDAARRIAYIAMPLLGGFAFVSVLDMNVGFNSIGYVIWPIALAIHYWLMHENDEPATDQAQRNKSNTWYAIAHAVSVWIVVVLAGGTLARWVSNADLWRTAWASVTLVVAAIGALAALVIWAGRATWRDGETVSPRRWPLRPYLPSYVLTAAMPLLIGTYLGGLGLALLSNGNAEPLPYIPFINPAEITIALAIAVGVAWVLLVRRLELANNAAVNSNIVWVPYVALAFVFINTVWLRIAHHFFDVPWIAHALFSSFFVQTGYAILWSVMALVMMVLGHRNARRGLWVLGACLLGLTVVKLILIDMSNTGGVARVVAFIGVGVLILIVGFFAPLPPQAPATFEDSEPTGNVS